MPLSLSDFLSAIALAISTYGAYELLIALVALRARGRRAQGGGR